MKRLWAFSAFSFLAPLGISQVTVSGKVATADGSPLPDRITIQRDCGGPQVMATYADHNGQFRFTWGQSAALTPDASQSASSGPHDADHGIDQPLLMAARPGAGGVGSEVPDLTGCEVLAVATGYRSNPTPFANPAALEGTRDVGTIVLHPVEDARGSSVSATSLKAPSAAKKAFDKALESLGKGKTDDAEKNFEKAVGIYPQYAEAWLNLGKLRLQRKADDAAADALQKAVEADGKLVEAFVYLGMIDVGKKQWADAAKHLDMAVQLDPVRFPDAWFNDAVAGYNLKNYDAAEKSVREAMKLDPRRKNPQCDYLLGLILAAKKDYRGAAEQLKAYIGDSPDAPDVAKAKTQLAEFEKLQTQ